MDHNAIQDQLFALYDGELTGEARRAVEDHLLDCTECLAVVAQWKQVAGAAFQAPAVSTSETFVQRVMQRIAAPHPHPFRLPAPQAWLRQAGLPRRLLEGGWLVSAVGLAAVLIVMVNGPLLQAVSIESLLLSDGRDPGTLQGVLTGERSSADDVLGLLMEDAS